MGCMPAATFDAHPDKKKSGLFTDIGTSKKLGTVVKVSEYEGTGQGRLQDIFEVASAEPTRILNGDCELW